MKKFSNICYLIIPAFLFICSTYAFAGGTTTTVQVDSSSSGTQIVASIQGGVVVTVPSDAVVPVYFARFTADCSTLTAKRGLRIPAGNGYEFLPRDDGWTGQVCAVLQSGSTAVTVEVNEW